MSFRQGFVDEIFKRDNLGGTVGPRGNMYQSVVAGVDAMANTVVETGGSCWRVGSKTVGKRVRKVMSSGLGCSSVSQVVSKTEEIGKGAKIGEFGVLVA